jgi:hypothetical protein
MHHLLKLFRHGLELVELLFTHLAISEHVHNYLLWVSLE